MSELKFKLPTETIELPSRGLIYPEDNPLSSGKLEMKYMTAAEEDILTNQNYIKQGIVLDKLIESLIISKINIDDLIVGDKNAILIASRILGYGKDYTFKSYNSDGEYVDKTIDLTTLEDKVLIEDHLIKPRINEFSYTLPHMNVPITFKLLTHGDEKKIEQDLQGLKKIDPKANPEVSTRWKHIITSVNGDKSLKTIREFVDNYLLAKDSRALREHISSIIPGIKLEFTYVSEDYVEEGVNIPIGISFFWPDSGI
jgi:hypothetical protein